MSTSQLRLTNKRFYTISLGNNNMKLSTNTVGSLKVGGIEIAGRGIKNVLSTFTHDGEDRKLELSINDSNSIVY